MSRLLSVWRRVAVQQALNTLMRTVDLVIVGLFSPAAVAAVGSADLYAQIPLRVGTAESMIADRAAIEDEEDWPRRSIRGDGRLDCSSRIAYLVDSPSVSWFDYDFRRY